MGFPIDSAVSGPGDAERFVAARAAEGSDYVKIIVEPPQAPATLDADTVSALVRLATARAAERRPRGGARRSRARRRGQG